jgi:hypothetical protein
MMLENFSGPNLYEHQSSESLAGSADLAVHTVRAGKVRGKPVVTKGTVQKALIWLFTNRRGGGGHR